jgi:hypothetical protein
LAALSPECQIIDLAERSQLIIEGVEDRRFRSERDRQEVDLRQANGLRPAVLMAGNIAASEMNDRLIQGDDL